MTRALVNTAHDSHSTKVFTIVLVYSLFVKKVRIEPETETSQLQFLSAVPSSAIAMNYESRAHVSCLVQWQIPSYPV